MPVAAEREARTSRSRDRRREAEGERMDEHTGHENGSASASERESHGGMAARGVTRPTMKVKRGRGEDAPAHGERGRMAAEQRQDMLAKHHAQTAWVWWTVLLLGAWTVLAPATFGYGTAPAQPAGGREVWLTTDQRVAAMTWSDLASGAALLVLGWRALRPGRLVSAWACCFVGIWLTLAPVVFWAPSAAAYLNATVVGALVIALTILIPGMPGMVLYMKMGPDQPPGWSYNPSSWAQRSVLAALGFAGFVVSRYLAAYQLGYVDTVWDPFFGDGTRRVLESDMSRSWPVSDAAFGTVAYTFEFLMAFMGSPARWRTMPWMVTLFGILVIPLGLVHIALVVSQPVLVGEWCTFCLLAAAFMLPMLPLEGDEVVAMGQHVLRARRRGERVWSVFWKGGAPEGAVQDERSPKIASAGERPGAVARASVWGLSVPCTLAASAALGVLLMAAPSILGVSKPAADVYHLGGAVVVTCAVVAMGEVFRAIRYVNVVAAFAIAVAPWVLGGANTWARILAAAAGAAVAGLSLPIGRITERYGSWERAIV
jgi:hypothetical protein